MLQLTGVVDARAMRAQYLDRMDIERERGITIKSQAVRMPWEVSGTTYALNMIDTPGHVDFTYEVSRSLAACEGAVLLVDAAQGIEAQTLANLYLAMENDLHVIPVLNKIDLPAAQPEKYADELARLIGCDPSDVLLTSGKTGQGVEPLLDHIVADLPAPLGDPDAAARAIIFDSVYDTYRGVVTYVRVIDGHLSPRERIVMMSTRATHELLEIGVISPEPSPSEGLAAGEVGELHLSARPDGPWADRWTPFLGVWQEHRLRPVGSGPVPTGDVGSVDVDGWLRVLDRLKVLIVRGGANVYPAEVERVLLAHDGVAGAAVFGVPDPRLGERVAALVELSPSATVTVEELQADCAEQLARYKVPEQWGVIARLPRNTMGKVVRTELVELLTDGGPGT